MSEQPGQSTNASAKVPQPGDAERWAARLALVNEIARSAHSKLEMGDLLNSVVEAIHRSFAYYDVSIFLVDAEAGECVLVAQAGEFKAQGIEGYRQKLGVGIVGWVAEHGETVLANDTRQEPRHIVAFDGEESILSEFAVPIRLRDQTVGVMNVQKREVNAFDECDVMALETLSEQIAQAIANAQLFERTRLLRDLNRGIIDAMPSGLCVLDGDLRVLYTNPSFCALLGHSMAGISGKPVAEVLSDALLKDADIESAIEKALHENKTQVFANIEAHCSGVGRVLNIRVAPAQMPEGVGVIIMLEDVTQWRMAMQLAEERRGQLDLIRSHVPVAVVSFDLEGKFTYWHAGAERLFGYTDDEIVGKTTAYSLFQKEPDLRALVGQCQARASAEAELIIRQKNRAEIPVQVVLGKLLDKSEQHVGYTGIVLDITERHHAREELLREKRKLDNVVGVIGAGLALIDKDRRIVWANRTIRNWFGKGKIVGKHCHEVYCRRDTRCAICPSETCFTSARTGESEVALIRNDGALRQYHHAVTPVVGLSGEVEQVLKLTIDVTDQTKKVYQLSRLRQLGELMQGVLDLDRLLHFILTCVTAGQALGFNRAVLMLVDKDRNLVEGKIGVGPSSAEEASRIWSQLTQEASTLEDLLARYDESKEQASSAMDAIAKSIRVSLDDASHIVTECALGKRTIVVNDAHKDPRVHEDFRKRLGSHQFALVPLIARNEPVGLILADNLYTGQPISEEHVEVLNMFAGPAAIAIENAANYERLQEEKAHLEQAYRDLADAQDKLVRSERLAAIGHMAAHVAHEIRNPLVTIGGFADLTRKRPAASREDIIRYAEIIASEVNRLENILARVMNFSKPPMPLLREAFIQPVIHETVELLRSRAEIQNVEIQLDVAKPEVEIMIDPEQMKQVFLNLFHNALDMMKDGGRLSVRTDSDENQVTIVVGNIGDPIRPEDMPNLFEPFFSTKPGGTGLGLAVSQKIIQEHGGDIHASSLARGTEFTITLPLKGGPSSGTLAPAL